MKLLLPLLFMMSSVSAHEIDGTQVLKGTLDTKVIVKDVKTKCTVEVDKVKNLMEEDSFGNPAYVIRVFVTLAGENRKTHVVVKTKREYRMTNLFKDGETKIVKDYEYMNGDGTARLEIKEDGRLRTMSIPYEGQTVLCDF